MIDVIVSGDQISVLIPSAVEQIAVVIKTSIPVITVVIPA